jgi:hypothetical protein
MYTCASDAWRLVWLGALHPSPLPLALPRVGVESPFVSGRGFAYVDRSVCLLGFAKCHTRPHSWNCVIQPIFMAWLTWNDVELIACANLGAGARAQGLRPCG